MKQNSNQTANNLKYQNQKDKLKYIDKKLQRQRDKVNQSWIKWRKKYNFNL